MFHISQCFVLRWPLLKRSCDPYFKLQGLRATIRKHFKYFQRIFKMRYIQSLKDQKHYPFWHVVAGKKVYENTHWNKSAPFKSEDRMPTIRPKPNWDCFLMTISSWPQSGNHWIPKYKSMDVPVQSHQESTFIALELIRNSARMSWPHLRLMLLWIRDAWSFIFKSLRCRLATAYSLLWISCFHWTPQREGQAGFVSCKCCCALIFFNGDMNWSPWGNAVIIRRPAPRGCLGISKTKCTGR